MNYRPLHGGVRVRLQGYCRQANGAVEGDLREQRDAARRQDTGSHISREAAEFNVRALRDAQEARSAWYLEEDVYYRGIDEATVDHKRERKEER